MNPLGSEHLSSAWIAAWFAVSPHSTVVSPVQAAGTALQLAETQTVDTDIEKHTAAAVDIASAAGSWDYFALVHVDTDNAGVFADISGHVADIERIAGVGIAVVGIVAVAVDCR